MTYKMATITSAKTGKTTFVGESMGEFRRRLRQRNEARRIATNINRRGGSARAETLPSGQTVVIEVRAPEQFEARSSGGELVASGSRADVVRTLALREQAFKAEELKRRQISSKPTLSFVRGVSARTDSVLRAIENARGDVEVAPPKKRLSGVVLERVTTIKPTDFDLKTYNKLKKAGIDKTIALKTAKNVRRKQTQAIEKVQLVNQKINTYNKNYERSVNKLIDTLNKAGIDSKLEKGSFRDQVERKVIVKLTKFLNPFIVGTEVGGALSNYVTLREAGIIKPVEFFNKSVSNVGAGTKFIFTNNPRTTIRVVKNNTLKYGTKAVTALQKNLNVKTVEGLSNLITLAIILRPDKILTGLSKKGVNTIKKIARHPPTQRVISKAVKAPAFSFVGVAGGKGVKFKGKPLSKASKKAISRGQTKKLGKQILTKTQAKKARKELAKVRTEKLERLLEQVRDIKASKISQKTNVFGKRKITKTTILTEKQLGKKGLTTSVKVGKKVKTPTKQTLSKDINSFTKRVSPKEIQSGKTILLQKTQVDNINNTAKNLIKKVKNPSARKKLESVRVKNSRNYRTSDSVGVDLRPETVYKNLIVPETNTFTKGFRPGVKDKLLKSIREKQALIRKEARIRFKNYIKELDKQIIKTYKSADERVVAKSSFLVELMKTPKFSTGFLSKITSSVFASFTNNFFRALSLLNFQFNVLDDLAIKLVAVPIVKPKPVSKKVVSVKSVASKPVSKKVVRSVAPKPKPLPISRVVKAPSVSEIAKNKRVFLLNFGKGVKKNGLRVAFDIRLIKGKRSRVLEVKLPINRAKDKAIKLFNANVIDRSELLPAGLTRKKDITSLTIKKIKRKK